MAVLRETDLALTHATADVENVEDWRETIDAKRLQGGKLGRRALPSPRAHHGYYTQ